MKYEDRLFEKEINGNWYSVYVSSEGDSMFDRTSVIVCMNYDGSKLSPDHRYTMRSSADMDYGESTLNGRLDKDYGSLETMVSRVVNEAVCMLEEKQDEKEVFQEKVEAALEANAEVHGGIEYQLDSEDL